MKKIENLDIHSESIYISDYQENSLRPYNVLRNVNNTQQNNSPNQTLKNIYKKNKKIKLGNMIKEFSKLDRDQLPSEMTCQLDKFLDKCKQIKYTQNDLITCLKVQNKLFTKLFLDQQRYPEEKIQKSVLNQVDLNDQKKIKFLNLQKRMKIMQTRFLKYLHKREYFPISDKHLCQICKTSFQTGKQLGGHMSRSHPGKSQHYIAKKEVHDNKKEDRQRRKYFQKNKQIKQQPVIKRFKNEQIIQIYEQQQLKDEYIDDRLNYYGLYDHLKQKSNQQFHIRQQSSPQNIPFEHRLDDKQEIYGFEGRVILVNGQRKYIHNNQNNQNHQNESNQQDQYFEDEQMNKKKIQQKMQ